MIDPKRILFQDEHFLAVHKLSGELVVRGKGPLGKLPLLDFLRPQFPGIRPVNRLDFDTSGIVLFARTKGALAAMMPGEEEQSLQMEKTYRTIVAGVLPLKVGAIRAPLPSRITKQLVPAETKYKVLEVFEVFATYAEASFVRGRHHQLRRHFAAIKHPIFLDPLYGNQKLNDVFTKRFRYCKFFLHAVRLSFVHPYTKQKIVIEAALPAAFEAVLKKLREAQ